MKEKSQKINLLLFSIISFVLIVETQSSKLISLKATNISEVESGSQCMIANCLQCEPNLPYTCSKCESNKTCCSSNCLTCISSDPTVCKQCREGFYYNVSTKSCQLIQQCNQVECIKCSSDRKTCLHCNIYYFFNQYTKTCMQCPAHCQICKQSMYCIKCDYHSFFQNNSCVLCDENCLQCSQNKSNCTSCQLTKYLDKASNSCKICLPNCVLCEDGQSCLQCLVGYFFNEKTLKCEACGQFCMVCKSLTECRTCVDGYYLNQTTKYCNTCDELIQNCLLCKNQTKTYDQKKQFGNNKLSMNDISFFEQTVSCTKCFQGYFLSALKICKPCINNCAQCTNNFQCTKCQPGYFKNQVTKLCDLCNISFCSVCQTATTCLVCKYGYFWNNITHVDFPACEKCRNGCASCGINHCTDCQRGFYLLNQVCLRCSEECGTCIETANKCTTCSRGFFYTQHSQKCFPCRIECLKCTDYNRCDQCAAGFRLENSSKCIPCEIKNCTYCTVNHEDNRQYCLECSFQFYLLSNRSCQECAKGCKKCKQSPTYCTSCIDGYIMDIKVFKCNPCPQNCFNCQEDGLNGKVFCTSCKLNHYMDDNNECQQCNIENCINCYKEICIKCKIGYYVDQQRHYTCVKCQQNCTQCSSKQQCTDCIVGFYLTKDYQCISCGMGCSYCDHKGKCIVCESGYDVNINGSCNKCSVKNCANCQNDTNLCMRCLDGYQLQTKYSQTKDKNDITLKNVQTAICFSCGQQLLIGCSQCKSSTKCLSCIDGYKINDNNLCSIQTTTLWPWIVVVSLLSIVLLLIIIKNIKQKLNGKKLSQLISKKSAVDPQNYHRLQQLSINQLY